MNQKNPTSQPLSFWTEQDILHYIKLNNIEIASAYGDIVYTDKDGCNMKMICFNIDELNYNRRIKNRLRILYVWDNARYGTICKIKRT